MSWDSEVISSFITNANQQNKFETSKHYRVYLIMEISRLYGNKLRIRVHGICIASGKLLLLGHQGLRPDGLWWAPPGGGVEPGESLEEAVRREMWEETNLNVTVGPLISWTEFLQPPLHAVEFFFHVQIESGEARLGHDPENTSDHPWIQELDWLTPADWSRISPEHRHRILNPNSPLLKYFS